MSENKNRAPNPSDSIAGGRTESNAELVAHLERLTGRRIKSRQDISDCASELSTKAKAKRSKSQHLKNFLLIALLIVSAAQYYFLDVQFEILAQPTLIVFVPAKGDLPPRRPYI